MGTWVIAIVGVAGTVFGIVFGYVSYLRSIRDDGVDDGTLRSDTQYIKDRIDDVLLAQKETTKSICLLFERVTRVEESAKQAHHRIDRMDANSGVDL